jgi:hypothetical protein
MVGMWERNFSEEECHAGRSDKYWLTACASLRKKVRKWEKNIKDRINKETRDASTLFVNSYIDPNITRDDWASVGLAGGPFFRNHTDRFRDPLLLLLIDKSSSPAPTSSRKLFLQFHELLFRVLEGSGTKVP